MSSFTKIKDRGENAAATPFDGKAGSDSAPIDYTPDIKGRVFELAAEVARLVCVEDAVYVDDKKAHRALDLAANELGYLLKLPEPEFENLWRGDDTLGVRRGS